jgi:hypothetical protein
VEFAAQRANLPLLLDPHQQLEGLLNCFAFGCRPAETHREPLLDQLVTMKVPAFAGTPLRQPEPVGGVRESPGGA